MRHRIGPADLPIAEHIQIAGQLLLDNLPQRLVSIFRFGQASRAGGKQSHVREGTLVPTS